MPQPPDDLLIRPATPDDDPTVVTRITAGRAGWEHLNAEIRGLSVGQTWSSKTGDHEAALVVLGGRCGVTSDRGEWSDVGRRPDVFSGMPYALYLPRATAFTVTARTERLELAHCWVPTDEDHPARLVTPADVEIEIRGGGHCTRQKVNHTTLPR